MVGSERACTSKQGSDLAGDKVKTIASIPNIKEICI